MKTKKLIGLFASLAAGMLPLLVSAHEVYVLSPEEVARDVAAPSLNLFKIAFSNKDALILWGIFGVLAVALVAGISLSRKIGAKIGPFIQKIKPHAGRIAQATLGLALLASAYYGALFGAELPFTQVFGPSAYLITLALTLAGISVVFGFFPRLGALLGLLVFLAAVSTEGFYMVAYLTYVGEALVILIFGGSYRMLPKKTKKPLSGFLAKLEKAKYFIMRICFSVSLLFGALYAKLVHGQLAVDTVTKYHLTNYFHFDPLFVVLGAFLVEMTIAIFYLIGFEVRFASIVFLAFLTLSLCFFGEAVWPHIILIGTAISMFVHGYDEFTVGKHWYKKGKAEPVL